MISVTCYTPIAAERVDRDRRTCARDHSSGTVRNIVVFVRPSEIPFRVNCYCVFRHPPGLVVATLAASRFALDSIGVCARPKCFENAALITRRRDENKLEQHLRFTRKPAITTRISVAFNSLLISRPENRSIYFRVYPRAFPVIRPSPPAHPVPGRSEVNNRNRRGVSVIGQKCFRTQSEGR